MALDALVGESTCNSINDNKHNNTKHSVFYSYAECRYADHRSDNRATFAGVFSDDDAVYNAHVNAP